MNSDGSRNFFASSAASAAHAMNLRRISIRRYEFIAVRLDETGEINQTKACERSK